MMRAGIGLRAPHYQAVLESKPNVGFLEVHSENYFGKSGKSHYYLEKIREHYPLSFHGVGLSLGSADELNMAHLDKLKKNIRQYNPLFISEHLSWSSINGHYLHDLLPLPYTEEALVYLIKKISFIQNYLDRQLLIENISSYVEVSHSTMPEYEFMKKIAESSGCGILLDINNIYVNSINHGWDAKNYVDNIPKNFIKEIHLAGFTEKEVLIDSHNQPVSDPVWELYQYVLKLLGPKPTLIEWDTDLPELDVLVQEAEKANAIAL